MKSIYLFRIIMVLSCSAVFALDSLTVQNPQVQLLHNRLVNSDIPVEKVYFDVKYVDAAGEQVFRQISPADLLVINIRDWKLAGTAPGQVRLTLEASFLPTGYQSENLQVQLNLQSRSTCFDAKGVEASSEITDYYRKLLDFGRGDVIEVRLQDIWPTIFKKQAILLAKIFTAPAISPDAPLPSAPSLVIKPLFNAAGKVAGQDSLAAAPAMNEYSSWTEQALDKEFKEADYIANREERKQYRKLSVAEKRIFLLKFWQKRDPIPKIAENEFKRDYQERVQTAAYAFSTQNLSGVDSDRGRVLLLYGYPDEAERRNDFPNRSEVWRYFHLQGGVVFVFVEKDAMGDMRLIHSTARNEVAGLGWNNNSFMFGGNGVLIDYRKHQK